jgi:hypothetical protein
MGFADTYFAKQDSFKPIIKTNPSDGLVMTVIIPSYKEPDLFNAIHSLASCDTLEGLVEIIIIINYSDQDQTEIINNSRRTYQEISDWIKSFSSEKILIHPILIERIPEKIAGVGTARKIGMDEALWRFHLLNKKDGIIVNFDADAVCTPDYLKAIEEYFKKNFDSPGASIYYEHKTEGDAFPEKVYRSIIKYELYLRYYILALRYSHMPWSYHTLGSSFAVKALDYMKQGGMNRRKAGEDFYFLHKIIPLGNYGEINSTCITLSPRPSDRVPFGTGAAVNRLIEDDCDDYYVYNVQSFIDLLEFNNAIPRFFKASDNVISNLTDSIPVSVLDYLRSQNYLEKIREINENCTTLDSFMRRFYSWINGFWVLKWLNTIHADTYKKESVRTCVIKLMKMLDFETDYSAYTEKELLIRLRQAERNKLIKFSCNY